MWSRIQNYFFSICGAVAVIATGLSPRLSAATNVPPSQEDLLIGKPVIGRSASGVLELFDVTAQGELRHRWQKPADGDWSLWSSLGGGVRPGIAVANGADGRLVIFAVDRAAQALKCLWQRQTNSLEWSDWLNLGGAIRPPVAAGANADGRLEVFAAGASNSAAEHLWQTDSKGGWSPWASLGGSLNPGLVAARNRDGRLEVFGIGTDSNNLVHAWQRTPGNSADWSAWMSLGGSILPGFVVGQNATGRLEVFAVQCPTQAVARICQSKPADSESWTSWLDFAQDNQLSSPPVTRDVVGEWREFGSDVTPRLGLGKSRDGRIEIFAVNARDGSVLHRWETRVDGSDLWSQWASMGQHARPAPAVAQNEDGNLEVFAVDRADGQLIHHRRQISSASDWLDWSSLDHRTLQYRSRVWQVGDGLPDNMVQAVTQTRDGFLWVGTREGLARFDGTDFTIYDAKNTAVFTSSSIPALCAGTDGALWVGTEGGGLIRLKDGVFTHYGKSDGLAGNVVRVICEAKDGSLWIGTDNGMSRYKDGRFADYSQKSGWPSASVSYICEDRDGNLWLATAKGLNRMRAGGAMDSFNMPNRLPDDSVRGICQDTGGRIWVGSNNGLLWYNWYWGQGFYAYNSQYGLSDPFVSAVCEDREGNLWVGTYSGLNRFQQGRFYSQLDNEGLPFDRVNVLYEDRQGNLWVGTKEGLVRLTPKHFSAYTRQQGLTHNNVTSVLRDRAGSLWIGTWGGGLNELKDERVISNPSTNSGSRDLILSLCEGHDGSIWAGADFDGGLLRIKDGQRTRFDSTNGLPNTGLRVLHEDASGTLWIGTSRGLCRMKDGKFTTYTMEDHLAGNVVRAICEDKSGQLWFGTDRGLSCRHGDQFINFTITNGLSDNAVTALLPDGGNGLWVGTEGGGLNRFRDGRFKVYGTRDGLFSDEIFSIVKDDAGWLWMSCSKGVFRVRTADLDAFDEGRIKVIASAGYDKSDGMESAQCNGVGSPTAWKTPDGKLWFPTTKGLVTVDPAMVTQAQAPPFVYIRQIVADRKPLIGPLYGLELNLAASPNVVSVEIPPGRGEVELQYSALNLSAPEKSRFRYRLTGIDSDWVDAGTRRSAYYNNLPAGRYRFQVAASNKDGVWNQSGTSVGVELLPHYWETWWFRALVIVAVVGGASGTALYATRRRMQRKLNVLKQRHAIENERGRIAKDIHDDLGSSLTRIMMLGQRAEDGLAKQENVEPQIRKIVDSARKTVQALDEIVWAVNPENDTLDGLMGYIIHYADEFFENAGVSCRLEMPDELPACELSAELRHNLFLMIKESFNNVVKHSHATAVSVRVTATDSSTQIVVEDNGRGFDPSVLAKHKRSGLVNMSRRMKDLGGEFHVTSEPGQGARLEFTLKLNLRRARA